MSSHDQPEEPPESPGPQAAGPDRGARLRRAMVRLQGLAQRWEGRSRSSSFVPATETVLIDARRHPFLLVTPALRTVAGLTILVGGLGLLPLLLFAAVTAVWAQARFKPGVRTSATIAAGAAVALIALDGLSGPLLCALLLLGWATEDVADWYSDRLVVTDKRLYRRHGVVTRHSPSISLTAIAYIDAAVPPIGNILTYGTLRLDSVAQRDAPLSRFDFIPDVVPVSHEILRLRSQALPKFPPMPH